MIRIEIIVIIAFSIIMLVIMTTFTIIIIIASMTIINSFIMVTIIINCLFHFVLYYLDSLTVIIIK